MPYHWFWSAGSESGRSYFSYIQMVSERIPPGTKRLVDIGCGDGRTTAVLKDVAMPGGCVKSSRGRGKSNLSDLVFSAATCQKIATW